MVPVTGGQPILMLPGSRHDERRLRRFERREDRYQRRQDRVQNFPTLLMYSGKEDTEVEVVGIPEDIVVKAIEPILHTWNGYIQCNTRSQYKIHLQSLVFEFAGVVDGAIKSWGFSSERFLPIFTDMHEALSTTRRFHKADEIVPSTHIRILCSK